MTQRRPLIDRLIDRQKKQQYGVHCLSLPSIDKDEKDLQTGHTSAVFRSTPSEKLTGNSAQEIVREMRLNQQI